MKKKLNFDIVNICFMSFFIVLITIIRVFQLKFFTDFKVACNNFKTLEFLGINLNLEILSYVMYSLILIYLVFLVFFTFTKKEDVVCLHKIKEKTNVLINYSLILFFVLTLLCLSLYLSDVKNFHLKGSTVFYSVFSQIFLSLYFLFLFCYFHFGKINKKSYLNIIFLSPVIWGVVRILEVIFLGYYSLLTPRELIINNLKISSYTMFFFCFGKILIGANSKSNERYFNLFGNLSIFFSLISIIPRTIVFLTLQSKDILLNKPYEYNINIFKGTNFSLLDFFISVFIVIILFRYLFYWKKDSKFLNKKI